MQEPRAARPLSRRAETRQEARRAGNFAAALNVKFPPFPSSLVAWPTRLPSGSRLPSSLPCPSLAQNARSPSSPPASAAFLPASRKPTTLLRPVSSTRLPSLSGASHVSASSSRPPTSSRLSSTSSSAHFPFCGPQTTAESPETNRHATRALSRSSLASASPPSDLQAPSANSPSFAHGDSSCLSPPRCPSSPPASSLSPVSPSFSPASSVSAACVLCRCPLTQRGLWKHAKRLHSLQQRRQRKLRSLERRTLQLLARADRRQSWMRIAQTLQKIQALQADRPVSALPALREAKAQQEAEREVLERNVAEKRKALDAVEKKKSLLLAEVARLKRKLEAQAEAENFDLASEDLNEEQRRIEAEEEELEKVKERLWGVQEDLRLHEAMKRTTRDREGHGPEDNERTAADASRAEKAVALRKETAEKREELRKFEASILRKQQWLSHLSLEIEKVLDRTSLRFRPSPTHALPSPCSTAPPHSAGVSALSSPSTFLAREPEMLSSCLPARKDARGAAHRRPRDTAGDLEKRALRALAETAGEKTAESESRRKREGETPSSFIGRQLGEEDELFELEAEVTACCQDLPVLEELLQERLARACLLAGQAEPPFARSPLALSPRSSPRAASTGTLAGAVDPKEGQLEIEKEEDRGREAEEHRAKEAVTTQQGTPAMPHTRADPVCLQVNAALSGCMYTPEVLPEKQTKQRTGRSPLSMASPRPLSRTSSLGGDPREKTDGFREEDLTTTEAPSGACTPPLLNHASVTRGSTFKAEATASLANLPSRGAAECASAPASSTPPAASGVYVQRKFPANQPVSSPVRRSRLCFSRRSDSSKESPSSASPKSQVETLPISRNSSSAAWTSRSERRSPARSRSLSETLSEDGREGRGDAAQAAKGEKLERALDAGEAARSGEENRFSFEAEARLKTACTQRREPRRTEAAEDQPWNALLAWASSWTGEAGLRSPRERKAEGRTPSVSSSQRGHRRALPPLRSCSSSSSSSLSPTPSACFSPSGSSFSSASSFGPERVARGDGTRTVLREKRENVEADGALDAPAETMWETLGPATAKRDENVVKNLGKLLALLEALPDVDLRAPKASSEKAVAQKNARARRDGPGERGQRRQATKETGTKTWNRRGAQEKRRGSCDVPDSRNSSRCPSTSPLPSPLPSSSCSSAVCTEVVTGTALLPEARRETQSGRRGRFAPECVAFQASSFARVSEKGEERREGQSDGGARAQEANTSAGDRLRAVAGEERPGGGGALHREEEEDAPKEGNTPRGEDAPKQEEKGARKPEEEEARKQEEEDARKQEEEDARKQEEEDAAREKADRAEEGSSVREEEIGAERGEGERVEEDGSGESPRGTATEEEAERSREEEGPRKDSGASSLFSRASGAHCEPENGGRGMGAQHVLEETLEATGTLQSDCGSDGEQTGEDKLENGMRSAGGFADGRGGDALNGNGSKEAAEETREGRFLAEGAPILQGGEDEREQALATLHERGGRESAGEEAEKAARHKEKEHAETGEDGRRGEATCGAEASPWTRGEREETNAKTEREEEEAEGEENRAVVEEGEEAAFIATEAGERFEQDGAQDAVAGQDDRGEEEEKRTRKLRREEAGEEARRDSRFCATQPEREGEREARRDRASDGEEEGTQKRDREEERRGRKEEKEQKVSVSGGPVKDLVAPAFSETIARAESPGKGEVDASCLSLVGCEEIKDASAETPPRTPLRTPVAGRHDSSGRPQSPSCLSFSSLSSRRGSECAACLSPGQFLASSPSFLPSSPSSLSSFPISPCSPLAPFPHSSLSPTICSSPSQSAFPSHPPSSPPVSSPSSVPSPSFPSSVCSPHESGASQVERGGSSAPSVGSAEAIVSLHARERKRDGDGSEEARINKPSSAREEGGERESRRSEEAHGEDGQTIRKEGKCGGSEEERETSGKREVYEEEGNNKDERRNAQGDLDAREEERQGDCAEGAREHDTLQDSSDQRNLSEGREREIPGEKKKGACREQGAD